MDAYEFLLMHQYYSGTYYLLDTNGDLIFTDSHMPSEVSSYLYDSGAYPGGYDVRDTNISYNDWKLLSVVPLDVLTQNRTDLMNTIIIAGIALTAVYFIIILGATYLFTRPITQLAKSMNRYTLLGEVELFYSPHDNKRGEVAELYRSFSHMTSRIDSLLRDVFIAEIHKKEAELIALQAQINPHFLYNTLDSINWLADKYQADEIQYMVSNLASLMRLSLNNGRNMIKLYDELQQVQCYMNIQKIRYSDGFVYEINADSELFNIYVIKLIIQPLVENSIVHGCENNSDICRICIDVLRTDSHAVFKVSNDGPLIDLQKMQSRLTGITDHQEKGGYGAKNVHERLINHYGEDSGLVYSIDGNMTVATFKIPYSEEDEYV